MSFYNQLKDTVAGLLPSTLGGLLSALAIFAITLILSMAVVTVVLIKLPATYFHPSHPRDIWRGRHPILRAFGLVAKNIVGAFLVVLGILLSLPGVPGQGILTILLGIMLMDFPGKRQLEYKIVSQPKILLGINRLRGRFQRPPLLI